MPIIHREDGIAPSKSRMVIYDETHTSDIAPSNSDMTVITPPKGYNWKITSLFLEAPAPPGAASGTHQWMLGNAVSAMLRGISVFGSSVEWDASVWKVADSEKIPSTEIAALYTLINSVFDSNNPVVIIYYNNTNAVASGTREIEIVIEETPKI